MQSGVPGVWLCCVHAQQLDLSCINQISLLTLAAIEKPYDNLVEYDMI